MKKYFKRNIGRIIRGGIISIIGAGFVALLPYITSNLIDNVNALTVKKGIVYAASYLGAIAGFLLFEYFGKISSYDLMKSVMLNLRIDLSDKIMRMPMEEYKEKESSFFMTLMTDDVKSLYTDYFDCIFSMITGIAMGIVYSVYMFMLNPIMASIILLISVGAMLIPEFAQKRLSSLREKQSVKSSEYLNVLREELEGWNLVNERSFASLKKRHDVTCEAKEIGAFAYYRFKSFVEVFAGLALYMINIAAFICGIILIKLGKLTAGEFVGLMAFIDLIAIPVRDVIYQIIGLKSCTEIKNKISDVLLSEQTSNNVNKSKLQNSIIVKDLNYTQGDFKLQDVNYEFLANRKYAIVGKSGAGKSTILKILGGVITQYGGEINIDGVDIRNINLSELVARIDQEPFVFSASTKDNVTLFDSYSDEKLSEYIKMLNADNLVRDNLGENGDEISGGEKNKIALLRALVMECKVMLCDEMFAALDENSRKQLGNYLFARKDITVISVTHDISEGNLKQYDEILIVDGGKITHHGTYTEMKEHIAEYFSEGLLMDKTNIQA